MEDKKALRKYYLKIRNEIPAKLKKRKSVEICKQAFANLLVPKNGVVALYNAYENEVDVRLLIDTYLETGKKVCLPCVEMKDEPMVFRQYEKGDELILNSEFGFLEPMPNKPELFPDVVICPLVAFDASGTRLGFGGGFYDRTLERLAVHKEFIAAGMAFSEQQAPYIKSGGHDFKMDIIFTDKKIFTF